MLKRCKKELVPNFFLDPTHPAHHGSTVHLADDSPIDSQSRMNCNNRRGILGQDLAVLITFLFESFMPLIQTRSLFLDSFSLTTHDNVYDESTISEIEFRVKVQPLFLADEPIHPLSRAEPNPQINGLSERAEHLPALLFLKGDRSVMVQHGPASWIWTGLSLSLRLTPDRPGGRFL